MTVSNTPGCTFLRLCLLRLLFLMLHLSHLLLHLLDRFHELPLMLQSLLHDSVKLHRVHHGLLMLSLRSRLALARSTPPLEHVTRSAAGAGAMHSTTGASRAIAKGSATK